MPKKKTSYDLSYFHAELETMADARSAFSLPLHVLLGEAADVARLFASHWASVVDGGVTVRLGLDSVSERLSPHTGLEIVGLVKLVQEAQTEYRLAVQFSSEDDPIGRGQDLAR